MHTPIMRSHGCVSTFSHRFDFSCTSCIWIMAAWMPSLRLLILTGGGAYPVGGASEIAFHIIPVIEAAGGKVLVRAEVNECFFFFYIYILFWGLEIRSSE